MKNRLYILIILVFVLQGAHAQSVYYYYNNQKVYIENDTEYISVNSFTDDSFLDLYRSSFLSKTKFVENNSRNYVQTNDINILKRKNLKNYYSEIKVIDSIRNKLINYNSFVNTLNKNPSTIKASPCYKTVSGKRLGLTNNFYVKINPRSINFLYEYAQRNNLEVLGRDPYMDNWYILSSTKNNPKNSLEYANQFHESGLFITAEPEFVYHDLQTSNDPLYNSQWGLLNTGQYGPSFAGIDTKAVQAWNITKGNNVKVAIYDHGFEMNHPDLLANVYGNGFDATTGTSPSQVRGSHGTACAGIIGAVQNNNLGVSGVAPESDIISISINLTFSDTPAQLASGFNWAWQNGVEVISNSWGGYAPSTIITDAVYNAINNGRNGKGCIVVFASGNENNTNIRYPGSAVPEVLVVGAASPCGERKNFSSCDGEGWGACYGSQLDIVAPGVKIPTTDRQGNQGYSPNDYHSTFNGTSSACPHVAGVAALILSIKPGLTAQQVRNIIEKTAQKVGNYSYTTTTGRPNGTWNNEMGYGLVNAHAAVQMAQSMCSGAVDLYVKDSQNDTGAEPNTVTQYMWTSDNIWVRNSNDNSLTHQNPDYSANGNPNYVKVRVINKGCVASAGNEQLKLYWAKASTALGYPNPWMGGVNHPGTGASMGSPIGTLTIPVIQPGQETILTFSWLVPNPANYGNDGDQWHFCLLARIEATNDPMTFPETSDLNANVRNNNNIAWKNVTVVDVLPNNIVNPGGVVAVGNPFNKPKTFFLEMQVADLETGKPIFKEAEVGLKMNDVLYRAWERGGKEARLLDPTVEERRKIVKGNNVILDNISFNANEIGTLRLNFNFLTKEMTDKTNYAYHVIQKDVETGQIIGGETFIINKNPRAIFKADAGGDKEVDLNQAITISAEDINEPAIYNWYDKEGNLIYKGKDLQIANAVADQYKLEVISTIDGFKDYTEVKVKLKPSILENIAPNPASNRVQVSYKLNGASSAYLMVIGYYGSNGTSNNYILEVNSSKISLDISNYQSGFYSVALVVNGKIVDAKTLVKQ